MLKKTVLTLVAGFGLATSVSAVNLDYFNTDFKALMEGLAHDVAPSLRMGALSGDLQGDASIDHFSITFPGIGISATDGLGRILAPGAHQWDFALPLSDLVNKNVGGGGDKFFEHLMLYPSLRVAAGIAWNSWDFSLSGAWLPEGVVSSVVSLANDKTLSGLNPKISFGNIGFQVRKTLLVDSGWAVPALSLGAGYHLSGSTLGVTLKSLDDLGFPKQDLGGGQSFDMGGSIEVKTSSTVFTVDLQASKHFIFFTPYAKLTGAYQNSTFEGNADLNSVVYDDKGTLTTADDTTDKLPINSKPSVNVSDFAILTTTGFELNLFALVYNFNVVADLSRAFLDVQSFSLSGIKGNAFSINTGFRYAF